VKGNENGIKSINIPSFEEGPLRPINKMPRYLRQGAAGEVRLLSKPYLTSPAAPISGGSVALLNRRGRPSSKEGIFSVIMNITQ
jgi:hypothetical protein